MTEINIFLDDNEYMISITGHAGYKKNENDNDIVCAAASCLAETLSAALCKLEDKKLCKIMDSTESDGCRLYRVQIAEDDVRVKQTIETIKTGFELLENTYPNYIKIFFE